MRFAWDEEKRADNLRDHRIDFAHAHEMFSHPLLVALDTREDYGEERWQGIGLMQGRVVVVVFTERAPDLMRIISVRKANSRERAHYARCLDDQLGTS